jgi:hypothetical protein
MITCLLDEFKKEHNGVQMNFGSKTELEIHEKGYYEKVEFILENCISIHEKIVSQEEAKIGYIACTDPGTEKEIIKDLNVLNKGTGKGSNHRNQ